MSSINLLNIPKLTRVQLMKSVRENDLSLTGHERELVEARVN